MARISADMSFPTPRARRQYGIVLTLLIVLGIAAALGLLFYRNPVPSGHPSFKPIMTRRLNAVITMVIATICQGMGTVAFQTVTNNRILTPSLLGYEALYATIQTATLFFFGTSTFFAMDSLPSFLLQVGAMILLSLLLYGWLLTGRKANLQLMLLVGIMLGSGLRSVSAFMRRLLDPSEFDLLQAKLFGSVNHARSDYFPVVIPIVLLGAIFLWSWSHRLNVLALGRETAISLGLDHGRTTIIILIVVAILMSISTALVGSMTFFGFLSASLAYQITRTYHYRYIFPMTLAVGFLILSGAYFLMYHVFHAQGVVTLLIELIGGLTFLILLFRKGRHD